MLFSIITSIKSVKNRIISFFKDQSGFSSIPRHDWFEYRIKDRTILAFDKVENYLLFNEFFNLCYFQLYHNYRVDTSLLSGKRNFCFRDCGYVDDVCRDLLNKKIKTTAGSVIYIADPYATYHGDFLAQPLHEMNEEINTTINIPVYTFLKFCRDRSLWVNDNPNKIRFMDEIYENWYSVHIPIDLDKFFMYREDLELLLILMEDVANILMSTHWEYVYPNDDYVDFRPIKGDIIRFIRLLRNYKNQYPFHTSSTFVSKLHLKVKLLYIRSYFFKLRLQKALKNRLAFFTTGLTTHLSLGILSLLAYYFIVPVGYNYTYFWH